MVITSWPQMLDVRAGCLPYRQLGGHTQYVLTNELYFHARLLSQKGEAVGTRTTNPASSYQRKTTHSNTSQLLLCLKEFLISF